MTATSGFTTDEVRAALERLYENALAGEPHDILNATRAYATLVQFIGEVSFTDPVPGVVEPRRLQALCRLFVSTGDMTPYAQIKFDQALEGRL